VFTLYGREGRRGGGGLREMAGGPSAGRARRLRRRGARAQALGWLAGDETAEGVAAALEVVAAERGGAAATLARTMADFPDLPKLQVPRAPAPGRVELGRDVSS
jgi:hypothetical protein